MALCCGCADQPPPPPRPAPLPPLLIHLPGIAGHMWVDDTFAQGMKDAGFPGDLEIHDWTHGDRGLGALVGFEKNQQQAQAIADMLAERFQLDPESPLFISGHSGGGAIAVWALEKLPPGLRVRDAVLLSPALSPQYDLTAALRHVSGHIHVFYSSGDNVVLGLGTSLFGNMDRFKGDAAGMVGFVRPQAGDAAEYAKLVGHPYKSEWAWLGNGGTHIGPMAHSFVQQVVAPLLVADCERGPVKY
jgi:pimeloyl-ACP methyl ester carboxylesterase